MTRKRIFSILLVVTLLLGFMVPALNVFAAQPGDQSGYGILSFSNGGATVQDVSNATSVNVTYSGGTVTVNGTGLYSDGTSIYAPLGSSVSMSATNNGKFRVDGTATNSSTYNIASVVAEPLNIEAENFGSANRVDAVVDYTYTNERAEITINGEYFDVNNPAIGGSGNQNGGHFTGPFEYGYDSGDVTIAIDTLFIFRLSALTINGTPINVTRTPAQLLQNTRQQMIHYEVTVAKADTYVISTTTVQNEGEYMTVGNFLWSYMDVDKGTDDYVGHGQFELVNVHYNNTDYSLQDIIDADLGYLEWNEWINNETHQKEGGAMLPAGAVLTVRLIPDAGYQLTSFTINGGEFEAGDDDHVGIYTFTVPRGNFHLGAHFTKVNNKVDADGADAITSGSIKLGGAEESMQVGTAKLGITNVDLEPAKISNFKEAAGDYSVKTYLDIKLFNTIYKGKANESWDEQVDELQHKAKITLKLADDVDGNDIVIVHEKHDGTYEIIETVFDPVKHTITFVTDSFSNYAIASRTIDTKNVKTTDNVGIYFIALMSSIIGLGAVKLFRKKATLK